MRDLQVEQWLNHQPDVKYHYECDVLLSVIDREASLKNQARFKALDYEHVDEIVCRLIDGEEMPALTGYYDKNGRIVLIDGNHRNEAYVKANEELSFRFTKTDLYIIDNPHGWVVDVLTREANTREGKGPSREERIQHALYIIKIHGMSEAEAEKRQNLPEGTINKIRHAIDVQERLARLGFQEKLAVRHLDCLWRLKPDNVLLETANLIKDADLDVLETAEIIRRIAAASASEKQQLAEVSKIRSDYDDRIRRFKLGGARKIISPIIRYRTGLNNILATREESVKPLDDQLKKRSIEVIKKIERILGVA